MLKKDFDLFKQQYHSHCKTKSDNPFILSLYSLLLEREGWDSDYWNEDHGATDIIHILEQYASSDWEALAMDLANWTTFQLELFTQAILGDYYGYTENGIYYESYDIDKFDQNNPKSFGFAHTHN